MELVVSWDSVDTKPVTDNDSDFANDCQPIHMQLLSWKAYAWSGT